MNRKLKVWWIPQVPGKRFEVEVATLQQADLLLKTLAAYDIFQYENNIKPDYCNAGGLVVFEEESGEWVDWDYQEEKDRTISELKAAISLREGV